MHGDLAAGEDHRDGRLAVRGRVREGQVTRLEDDPLQTAGRALPRAAQLPHTHSPSHTEGEVTRLEDDPLQTAGRALPRAAQLPHTHSPSHTEGEVTRLEDDPLQTAGRALPRAAQLAHTDSNTASNTQPQCQSPSQASHIASSVTVTTESHSYKHPRSVTVTRR